MRPYDRHRLDPLELRRRDVLDFLGLSRNSPLTLPELIVGPSTSQPAATPAPPAPAAPVEMVVVDGVRYRPEDAPGAPPQPSPASPPTGEAALLLGDEE